MNLLEDLNPPQLDAVTHDAGPLLILAGAGSGKTRVLTCRIAHLIRERGVNPYNILAITFTNKAAGEMRRRVVDLVGPIGEHMWVSTFHSACVRILRAEIQRLGMPRHFAIYDDLDQRKLIELCLKELNLDPKRFPPAAMQNKISTAKNELIDAETFASRAGGFFDQVVSDVYKLYQERLLENKALDFDDLIMTTVDLLRVFPTVLTDYKARFAHVLVDEYQDTNHAQYELVHLLAGDAGNICCVGDDDQSVYGWRGADIRNILEFEHDYPQARVIRLEQNYRSTRTILEAANYVVSNNRGRKPKTLWTANARGEAITRYQAADERDEAAFVASEVERLRELEDRGYRDFAVFYRTNAQSRVLEEVFIRTGLPYKIVGGVRFYERAEIKDMLAYLRVIANPLDSVSLKRIINTPKRGIGKTSIDNVELFSRREGIPFVEGLRRSEDNALLATRAKKELASFAGLLDRLERLNEASPRHALEALLEDSGYVAALEAERTVEALSRLENVSELLSVVSEFEAARPEAGLADFLEMVALITDIDSYEDSQDAVTLMTLHNAKGLEFPAVFIVGMEDGIFPHVRSMEDERQLEEERRLMYVGLTRAKERLYLTHAWSRSLYGATNYHSGSRFLCEIPQELIVSPDTYESRQQIQEPGASYEIGEEVVHKKFGRGRIVMTKGKDRVTVRFAEGEKTLLVGYAPMERVG
ncbi:MAG: DNA helicase PcrA [Actinobacteria bacterium]|nr:MAG: DNA helicase PcrA [Actinomycetota bacterium]